MIFHENELLASITRDSFYLFVKEFWGTIIHDDFIPNWHLEYLCDEMELVARRVFKHENKLHDIVCNIPPGSSKSTIISQMFPAWVWTIMPHAQFICASYAQAVAFKDAIRCRDIVQSDLYQKTFPEIQLREDENTKGLFMNTKKGFRMSVGVGGAVTGFHGHFLLVDDPLNPEESYSEADLKKINRWMTTTLPTRKLRYAKNVVPTILVQQRLHQADPSGELLATDALQKVPTIKHICLPGELTEDVSPKELTRYYKDGLLDPVRGSRAVLEEQRKNLGEYGYASQILQSPVPLGGGMFKVDKLNIMDELPKGLEELIRSWDKAGTKGGGAWTVGLLMARDKHSRYWILDVVREQLGATEREELITATADEDGDVVKIILEVEGGSGGKESAEGTVKNVAGYVITTYHPTGDKESRAYQFASQVGGGNVYVLNRSWTKALIEEMRFFPHSKYKDQVDAASSAFTRLHRKKKKIGGWSMSKTKQ